MVFSGCNHEGTTIAFNYQESGWRSTENDMTTSVWHWLYQIYHRVSNILKTHMSIIFLWLQVSRNHRALFIKSKEKTHYLGWEAKLHISISLWLWVSITPRRKWTDKDCILQTSFIRTVVLWPETWRLFFFFSQTIRQPSSQPKNFPWGIFLMLASFEIVLWQHP